MVVFSTLLRYRWPSLSQDSFPDFVFINPTSLIALLRLSSLRVLGAGIHDGVDGVIVELVSLEKVTKYYTNPGYCNIIYNKYSWMGPVGLIAVV